MGSEEFSMNIHQNVLNGSSLEIILLVLIKLIVFASLSPSFSQAGMYMGYCSDQTKSTMRLSSVTAML